jgi:hypothetical protein
MPNIPSFRIEPASLLCEAARANGLDDFRSLCAYVQALPYARVTRPNEPLLVLQEGRGTCSSKHQLLARVAHDCGHREVHLTVGIYAMSQANTPGVHAVLQQAGLLSIPEAHCYLTVGGHRFDFTGLPPGSESPFTALLEEHIVDPHALGQSKMGLHERTLESWSAQAGLSAQRAWSIREACIDALTSRPQGGGLRLVSAVR